MKTIRGALKRAERFISEEYEQRKTSLFPTDDGDDLLYVNEAKSALSWIRWAIREEDKRK